MFRKLLCKIGLHKWDAKAETIQRVDRYTIEADIVCLACGKEDHGQREDYY